MSAKDGIRDQVRAALFENVGIKLLSLCCAVALYAFHHGPQDAQRTIAVGVLSLMPPDAANRQLMTQLPNVVGVTLKGSRAQIDDIHSEDLGSVHLDLRTGRDQRVDLEASMFNVPAGVTVEQIIPSSIDVRWDDVVTRSIQVRVPRTGDTAPGFQLKGVITSDPATVEARGPRSTLDLITVARTAPFDVTGFTEGVHATKLAIDKPNLVVYNVEQVSALVEVVREQVRKPFPKLKVEVIGLPRATTRPATVTVTVIGTAEDVNAILPEAIVPRVEPKAEGADLTKPGKDNMQVLIDLPRVKVEVDPPKVVVTW